MADLDSCCKADDGRSILGFSLTSPDLVICTGSPDLPRNGYGDSPDILENHNYSTELSLENGINGSVIKDIHKTPSVKFSTLCQTFHTELSPESSFELLPPPALEDKSPEDALPYICINAGSTDGSAILGGVEFLRDNCFKGGDIVKADAIVGDDEGFSLYKTARFGNFSYNFQALESGCYAVDLHLAEIVFTNGPAGMRVFDVFIQEKKVVSCLDIYARVGANKPLVVADLKAFVDGENGLSIRFEGVNGSPILCGISIRKDSSANVGAAELLKPMRMSQDEECDSWKENGDREVEGDFQKLLRDYKCQRKELAEIRKAMEELKTENQIKTRECQDAWKSLKELQNELMRKSMHVGSLAFAIEGQVKEKSRWFSSLRDLTRKLKIMKMEHIKLSEEALAYKKFLADMNGLSSKIQSAVNQQVELHEDLKIKFIEGAKEQKELYNKVLELKGNIRVFCRCRPLNTEEIAAGTSMAIDFELANDGELTVVSNGAPRRTFKFDSVFGPQANQADVFEGTAPLATSVLDGYNVCIFAYGQTGTGKTFTMEGTEEARGVNFRTLEELFRIIKERQKQYRYDISVSVLEVYNEQIRDLLVSNSQAAMAAKRLEIRQVGEGIHHVPGLVEAHVNNMNEVWEVLQTGSNARAVGSTNANEHSSRSHCIHCVMVKGENLLNGERTKSKLWLVDLAGSERVAKTEVQGERLKETQNINRSLSALGDVISALATKSPHIPFRNSKLTHLLQDSLGGDSKTLMFVQISPNENDLSETLCSLNFASRVRGIELGPAKRQLEIAELVKYKQMADKSKQDMKSKDVQIRKMEETIHGLDLKIKEKDLKNKNVQDKVKELEAQLLIERKLARQHVDTKIAEQQQQMKQLDDQNTVSLRPPLANRPLVENNSCKSPMPPPSTEANINYFDYAEKENNTEMMAEQSRLSKRNGRASMFTAAQRIPPTAAPRRNSLIPLPSAPNSNSAQLLQPLPISQSDMNKYIENTEKENNPEMAEQPRLVPVPKRTGRASICTTLKGIPAPRRNSLVPHQHQCQGGAGAPLLSMPLCQDDAEEGCLPEQTHCDSPKGLTSGGSKKLSSNLLRRSLQKKIQMKSPMQQYLRKGGINVGMEKVRVSIGSRGRMAHRVLPGSGRRAGTKEIQQKQSQREKVRVWNIGTVVRTAI